MEDAMDSCCGTATNNADGYFQQSGAASSSTLFQGTDTTINNFPFGDGVLDVTDVFVTFRRSLDPTLTWFQRFWTKDGLAAETNVPNLFRGKPSLPAEEYSNADSLADNTAVSNEPPSAL